MKAKLLILVSLFFFSFTSHQVFSQQLTGRAIYKASNQLVFNLDSTEMSPAEMAEMEEMMKKPWQADFILSFTQSESNWKQVESLGSETATTGSDGMTINLGGKGDEILYKNLINQRFVQEQEFMGKMFLIEDSLDPIEWELTNETKKIGNYFAQKASYSLVVDAQQFSTGMAEMENVKDTINVTAWFTPDIPVSNGPENYFGLPGLILEVHHGGRSFYCEKIELNPIADPVTIQIPKQGKAVNSEEFRTMQEESVKQMIDRYQGKPGEKSKVRIGG
jgi:GLPGLI family protein